MRGLLDDAQSALGQHQQIRAHAGRIEKAFELRGGELADLLLGVINPPFVADAPTDLAHDLLDVD